MVPSFYSVHRRGHLCLTLYIEGGTYISHCSRKRGPISHIVHRRGYLHLILYTSGGIHISQCTEGIPNAHDLYRGVSYSLVYISMGNLKLRGGPTAQCKQKGDHSTVKTVHRNSIVFMLFKNIMHFIHHVSFKAIPILDKSGMSNKNILKLKNTIHIVKTLRSASHKDEVYQISSRGCHIDKCITITYICL